jgi:GTP cyclohydrolase I
MVDRNRAERAIRDFLDALGLDVEGELAETPKRVADAWIDELCEGYRTDVQALLRANVIARAGDTADVVVVRDIQLTTMCPHHLMPGVGTATVSFEPKGNVVAVGAVARLVHALSRRLSLQEAIGQQVARAIFEALDPKWAACRLVLAHTCMTARGERAHGARLETIAVAGRGDRAAIERSVGLGT